RSATSNTAGPAVKRHAIRVVHDHRAVHIDVAHHRFVYADDRGVVVKRRTAPFAAVESDAGIAEAIVHAAIEADVRTPISAVPSVNAVTPAPVSRRPKQPGTRRGHPHSTNPVVAGRPR